MGFDVDGIFKKAFGFNENGNSPDSKQTDSKPKERNYELVSVDKETYYIIVSLIGKGGNSRTDVIRNAVKAMRKDIEQKEEDDAKAIEEKSREKGETNGLLQRKGQEGDESADNNGENTGNLPKA